MGPVPSAADLVTTTRYDTAGRVIESRLPGDAAGTTPRSTDTVYYGYGTGPCASDVWAGLVCSIGPAAQPATGDPLAVTTYSYDQYGDPLTKTEAYGTGAGQVVRTTTATYDPAGRTATSSVSVTPSSAGGTALPTVTDGYSPATGLPTTTSTGSGGSVVTLTTGYDTLGQATSYTDATGTTSTTSYDLDGNPTSVNDGQGTTTYTYDSSTEHRGLVTSENIGVSGAPSIFSASYDAGANLSAETYPNGLVATGSYDNAGNIIGLNYEKGGVTWMNFTATRGDNDKIVAQSSATASPQSSQTYTYDQDGRLTTVQDTYAGSCATRKYGFDADSNRISLSSYPASAGGVCSTGATPTATSTTYDDANRDTNTGYTYDDLGRTSTVPAADASGVAGYRGVTGNLAIGYYSNDMVASQAQGGTALTFALDPSQDRVFSTSDGFTTTTNHYSDASDRPTWISTSPTVWSRNLFGPDGNLTATTDQTGAVTLELFDLRGDTVATAADNSGATGIATYSESTEYGIPRVASSAYGDYGWNGASLRSSDDLAGIVLMGVRLYDPATGRFLSVDPIVGGNANPYEYPADPVNQSDISGEVNIWQFLESYSWTRHTRSVWGVRIWTRVNMKLVFNRKTTHKIAEWDFFGGAIGGVILNIASKAKLGGPDAIFGLSIISSVLAIAAGIADLYGDVIVLHLELSRTFGIPSFTYAYATRQRP